MTARWTSDGLERSWQTRDEPHTPVDPLIVLLAVAVFVLAAAVGAQMNSACERWANGDPAKVASCERLNQ